MQAVVISFVKPEQGEMLLPRLQPAFGQVASYRRGRRTLGGPIHVGEQLLKRSHPELFLQAAMLLLLVPAAATLDVVDGVLGMVARLDDPSGASVEIVPLTGHQSRTMVGSAGR